MDATDKLCADIAEACSFENLKKADDSKDFPKTGAFKDLKLSVYRKGKTTDFDLLNSPGIRAIENTSYCSQKMYPTGACVHEDKCIMSASITNNSTGRIVLSGTELKFLVSNIPKFITTQP